MKKLLILLSIFFVSSVNAAEASYNVESKINISSDRTMIYTQNLSINDEFIFKYDVNVEDIFNQETYKISLNDKNYKVETLATNDTTGLVVSKSYPQINNISKSGKFTLELSKPEKDNFSDSRYFQRKRGLLYDHYIGNFTFDYSNFLKNEDIDKKELANLFNLSFEVNIPSKATKYNATVTNDDLTYLKWDLKPGVKNEVSFQFKEINITNLAVIFIISTILIVGLIIFIVKKTSNKLDELDGQQPFKMKKEKQEVDKKEFYNNGMTMNSEPISNDQQYFQNTQPMSGPVIQASTNNEQPVSLTINNNNNKIDLMASQDTITNSQPSSFSYNNTPTQQTQATQQEDYTSVFNQTFDDDKSGQQ